ncbi:MAG: hypothetical protein SO018_00210, partial [Ligilactobacillus saerimneri]|nr:hypothetical protein [Ligilactobacillus saerimneri]
IIHIFGNILVDNLLTVVTELMNSYYWLEKILSRKRTGREILSDSSSGFLFTGLLDLVECMKKYLLYR